MRNLISPLIQDLWSSVDGWIKRQGERRALLLFQLDESVTNDDDFAAGRLRLRLYRDSWSGDLSLRLSELGVLGEHRIFSGAIHFDNKAAADRLLLMGPQVSVDISIEEGLVNLCLHKKIRRFKAHATGLRDYAPTARTHLLLS